MSGLKPRPPKKRKKHPHPCRKRKDAAPAIDIPKKKESLEKQMTDPRAPRSPTNVPTFARSGEHGAPKREADSSLRSE
jgi:hypothetical protein